MRSCWPLAGHTEFALCLIHQGPGQGASLAGQCALHVANQQPPQTPWTSAAADKLCELHVHAQKKGYHWAHPPKVLRHKFKPLAWVGHNIRGLLCHSASRTARQSFQEHCTMKLSTCTLVAVCLLCAVLQPPSVVATAEWQDGMLFAEWAGFVNSQSSNAKLSTANADIKRLCLRETRTFNCDASGCTTFQGCGGRCENLCAAHYFFQ